MVVISMLSLLCGGLETQNSAYCTSAADLFSFRLLNLGFRNLSRYWRRWIYRVAPC